MEDLAQVESLEQTEELPFILGFLEEYKGAVTATTSGTYDQIDASDYD